VTFTVPATTQPGPQTNTVTTTSTTTDSNPNNNTATDTDTVQTSADLSITKSDGVTEVTANDGVTYTYTITVHNSGPSDAQNVSVSDTWPAGFTQGTISDPFGNVTQGTGGNFTATLGTLAAGADKSITVTFTVPASTKPGPQTNTVTTTSTTTDTNPNNNTASDTDTVTLQSISGVKFEDLNLDGIWEPNSPNFEPALPGWIIDLEGPNGLSLTTTTDSNGAYEFDGLPQGSYTLSEETPTTLSTQSVAASAGPVTIPVENTGIFIVGEPVVIDRNTANVEIQFVVSIDPDKSITVGKLNSAHDVDTVIAPSMLQTTANPSVDLVQNTLSSDNNFGNGQVGTPLHAFPACFDIGQVFIASNTDEITAPDTLLVGANLDTTNFRISEISGNGQTRSIPAGGSATLNLPNGTLVVDSDGSYTYTASLNPAHPNPGPFDTFQFKILNTTSGQETGALNGRLPPVDLPLVVNNGSFVINGSGLASGNVLATDHDPDGEALIVKAVNGTTLAPGKNVIVLPHGTLTIYATTVPGEHVAGFFSYQHKAGDALLDTFTYTASDANFPMDEGCTGTATVAFRALNTLSGFAYVDLNNDGIKESNERGIANVRIKLYRLTPNGYVFVRSVLTNSIGKYKFSNLGSGTYKLAVVRPTGFRSGKVSVGTVRGLVDGLVSGDPINHVVLGAGDNGINYDFGFLPSKSIFFA
jgi:hypothetical protein